MVIRFLTGTTFAGSSPRCCPRGSAGGVEFRKTAVSYSHRLFQTLTKATEAMLKGLLQGECQLLVPLYQRRFPEVGRCPATRSGVLLRPM